LTIQLLAIVVLHPLGVHDLDLLILEPVNQVVKFLGLPWFLLPEHFFFLDARLFAQIFNLFYQVFRVIIVGSDRSEGRALFARHVAQTVALLVR
jgi:hypothetical protein